jgi:hypothetical protein
MKISKISVELVPMTETFSVGDFLRPVGHAHLRTLRFRLEVSGKVLERNLCVENDDDFQSNLDFYFDQVKQAFQAAMQVAAEQEVKG